MTSEKFLVEDTYKPLVEEILRNNDFEDIKPMPRNALFDYIALKNGKLVFVEVKSRSPYARTQTFVITEKKIERLKHLEEKTGSLVYLFFINKKDHKIVTLQDFLSYKADMKPLKIFRAKTKDTGSFLVWQFDENKSRWHSMTENISDFNALHTKKHSDDGFRVWRVNKNDKNCMRRFYHVIPYPDVARELNEDKNVFVEGISRQTAHFATEKLTRMVGKKVIYTVSIIKTKQGNVLKGYLFAIVIRG